MADNLGGFFTMFFSFIRSIMTLLENTTFVVGQYTVSLASILFVVLVVGFVISSYVRSAKA